MFNKLKTGIAWVTLKFDDDSVLPIKTTLNEDILANYGVAPRVGYFYDLNKGRFIPFRTDAVSVQVDEHEPEFEDEVINFVNRFI